MKLLFGIAKLAYKLWDINYLHKQTKNLLVLYFNTDWLNKKISDDQPLLL